MTKGVSGRAGAALRGLRAGAGPRIGAVGLDLAVARQAAFFPLAGVGSISSNSPSSISCTLRRNASLREIDRRRVVLGETLRRTVQEVEEKERKLLEPPAKGEKAA